ncbi:MAG: phosphoribosylglycinamide formyltransferase [Candidatus Dormibacteraceae bacterium]
MGILASGRGSNLKNLREREFEIAAVATNRPSCGAAAMARECGIPLGEFSQRAYSSLAARDSAMAAWLLGRGVELVVNAGYDRILTPGFLGAFPGAVLNIHPSLLPAFGGGMDAVEQALAHGVKVTGCTVHLVTAEVDAGPILLQAAVPVLPGDTAESLRARIQVQEHLLLPAGIRIMEDRLAPTRSALG